MQNSRIALVLAGLVMASGGASAARPEKPSLVDRFIAGDACRIHANDPDLVWLETVGSIDGVRHEKLADEFLTVLTTLQEMMEDTGSEREDMIEVRVSTTSDAFRREIAVLISKIPELDGIPFSYQVVDSLSVKWARVGVDAVLRNPGARSAITAQYGGSPGSDCSDLPS